MSRRMIASVVGGIVVLGIIVGGIWWLRSRGADVLPTSVRSSDRQTGQQTQATTEPAPQAMQVEVPTDSDGDGLSDAEEARLGTNPQRGDTDQDGFTDGEEVVHRKSNPLIKDGAQQHPAARGYQP